MPRASATSARSSAVIGTRRQLTHAHVLSIMGIMPASSTRPDRLRAWIEQGLQAKGQPTLDRLVTDARAKTPPTAWAVLAADITARSGEAVSYETLRRWFSDIEVGASS